MQTIATKLLPSVNGRGYRIKATASGGASITIPQDHTMEECDKHASAALALMKIWVFYYDPNIVENE